MQIDSQKPSSRLSYAPLTLQSRRPRLQPSPLRLLSIDENPEASETDHGRSSSNGSIQLETKGKPDITTPPLRSILKRTKGFESEEPQPQAVSSNRFEISVVPYQTSCCGTLISVEHISDLFDGSISPGLCPTCKYICSFQPRTRLLVPPSPRRLPRTPPVLPPRPPFDAASARFGADDEIYPDTEHARALAPSTPVISEDLMRVAGIAVLTLFLYALLT